MSKINIFEFVTSLNAEVGYGFCSKGRIFINRVFVAKDHTVIYFAHRLNPNESLRIVLHTSTCQYIRKSSMNVYTSEWASSVIDIKKSNVHEVPQDEILNINERLEKYYNDKNYALCTYLPSFTYMKERYSGHTLHRRDDGRIIESKPK